MPESTSLPADSAEMVYRIISAYVWVCKGIRRSTYDGGLTGRVPALPPDTYWPSWSRTVCSRSPGPDGDFPSHSIPWRWGTEDWVLQAVTQSEPRKFNVQKIKNLAWNPATRAAHRPGRWCQTFAGCWATQNASWSPLLRGIWPELCCTGRQALCRDQRHSVSHPQQTQQKMVK